ncbi:cytochrome P450 18a1 [Temnothorax americanus]|uniref:cytochrome P450 18a1 n=1 Tax=Temnothorax americanus TaxID=1964332 RepID=UPI0040694F0F
MLVEPIMLWLWHKMGGSIIEVLCTLSVFAGVFLPVFLLVKWVIYIKNLPPGPWGMPIWGYLPFMKSPTHLHFHELAKKYGKIFSVTIGSGLTVVISDYRIIRDAFKREEFSGRPRTDFMSILDGYGIINTEGALWEDQRRFLHKNLRSFGMSNMSREKTKMNEKIMHEVEIFLNRVESKRGAPTDISSYLALSISNVICKLTMSVRFHLNDPRFERFMKLIDEGFKLFACLASVNYIPLFRHLPWFHDIRNRISQNRAEMAEFHQNIIDDHKDKFKKDSINDITDAYIHEIRQAENEGRELFQGKDKDRQMQQILGDLFSAGMETVKTTLKWAELFMVLNPEMAGAVQDELDRVVTRSRLPTLEDLPNLPITEATILEVLRRSNLVPLGTPHATTRDVELDGYKIPAGTTVIPLLYSVHMDTELWDDPEAFRPNRFLAEDGKVRKPNYFIPFGVGKRMCMGEVLARMELFLFFSCMMHNFNLTLPKSAPLPSLRGNVGITISPEPFEVCFLKRPLQTNVMAYNNVETSKASTPIRNIGSH